jgi:hypothetical protein
MTHEEAVRQWAETWPKIVARAWLEPAFRRRLLKDPASVLAEHGIPPVEGLEVQVVPGHARTQVTSKGPNATLVLRLPEMPKGFGEEDVSSLELATAPAMAKGCFCFCGGGGGGGGGGGKPGLGVARKASAKRTTSAKRPTGGGTSGGKSGRTAKKGSRR